MGNHDSEAGAGRKKKSDKAKITRQRNGPYSTRSARISVNTSGREPLQAPVSPEKKC